MPTVSHLGPEWASCSHFGNFELNSKTETVSHVWSRLISRSHSGHFHISGSRPSFTRAFWKFPANTTTTVSHFWPGMNITLAFWTFRLPRTTVVSHFWFKIILKLALWTVSHFRSRTGFTHAFWTFYVKENDNCFALVVQNKPRPCVLDTSCYTNNNCFTVFVQRRSLMLALRTLSHL